MQQTPSTQIAFCPDGKYRWAYEFNLYRNPTILFVLFKIFGAIIGIGFVIFLGINLSDMANGYADMEDLIGVVKGAVIFCLFWFALVTVSYYIYAAMQGGKYCVLFEMDDEGVVHKQYEKQVEKAQVVGLINVLAGIATANPVQAGIGINSSVKVNEPLAKNQVYADGADYDFVFSYIASRCPNATIKQ